MAISTRSRAKREAQPAVETEGVMAHAAAPEEKKLESLKDATDNNGNEMTLLAAYVRMWAIGTGTRVLFRAGRELCFNELVAAGCFTAFLFPLQPLALFFGFGMRVLALVISLPYVHDSQHWCMHTDTAFLIAIMAGLSQRWRRKTSPRVLPLAGLEPKDAEAITANASATIRFQFLLFYLAAGLFKANEGFMHPKFSCAPVYLMQILEQNLPASVLEQSGALLSLQTAIAPALILLVELLVPLLLLVEARSGMTFAALFHWLIAITPPPNDIASFGTQTLPRMILLVPDPKAAGKAVASLAEPGWRGLAVIGFTALTTALQPITWVGDFDVNVPVCGFLAAVVTLAAMTSSSAAAKPKAPPPRIGFAGWLIRLLAINYSLIVIPLGLQDMGTANMFSSLRMHGGSNHWLLPTGILQKAFADVNQYPPDSSILGEVYGGGIVRIESTNSSHLAGPLGNRYPGELLGHTEEAKKWLIATGHSGRQWSPMAFACAIGNHPGNDDLQATTSYRAIDGPYKSVFTNYLDKMYTVMGLINNTDTELVWRMSDRGMIPVRKKQKTVLSKATAEVAEVPFDPYTLPAAEVRRQVRQARARHPQESFDIVGAILDGNEGDEIWRAASASAKFVLERRFDGNNEILACYNPETESDCEDWVKMVLLTPPSNRWLAQFLSRILLSQPYPIIEEDVGAHRRLHCFGP